jgi:hypothetical protein
VGETVGVALTQIPIQLLQYMNDLSFTRLLGLLRELDHVSLENPWRRYTGSDIFRGPLFISTMHHHLL